MMLLQYSSLLWFRHHFLTKFFHSQFKDKDSFWNVTAPRFEISVCSTTLVETNPYLFYTPYISHLHRLDFLIKSFVDAINPRRLAHVSFFLSICIARVGRSDILSQKMNIIKCVLLFQKCLHIPVPHLLFETLLIILPENKISVWIVFTPFIH